MRKNPHLNNTPLEKRLRFVRAAERSGESNRYLFLRLDILNGASLDQWEGSDSFPFRQDAGMLLRHPMSARTPGLGKAPSFPITLRSSLADFFARRQTPPPRDGSRYDTTYRPAAIAARFLHYPLNEAFPSRNG